MCPFLNLKSFAEFLNFEMIVFSEMFWQDFLGTLTWEGVLDIE